MLPLLMTLVVVTQTAAPPAPQPETLRWDPRIDLPVSGVLVAGWIGTELAKPALTVEGCRWCATNDFDTAVRRAFNPSLEPSASGIKGPATASDVIGFGLTPLALLGLDALLAWHDDSFLKTMPVDVVLVVEATFSALAVTQLTKFLVARARPYSIGASPELLAMGRDPADANLSFFSGHTSFTFALATSAGTVMTLRNYRHAWVAWAVGLPLAVTTGLLRLGADKHWASDVLVGMAVGSVMGVGIPLLFHRRTTPVLASLQVSAMPNGVAVAGRF